MYMVSSGEPLNFPPPFSHLAYKKIPLLDKNCNHNNSTSSESNNKHHSIFFCPLLNGSEGT